MGSLQQALPHAVDEETEEAFVRLLTHKVLGSVRAYVEAVRAVAEACGAEGVSAVRERALRLAIESSRQAAAEAEDTGLRAYCRALEEGCRGSHEWVKVEDTDTVQAYRFTRCLWAECFRALNAEELGLWGCELDGPAAAAFNPCIRFRRTKTLMAGDDCCDHVYYYEKE